MYYNSFFAFVQRFLRRWAVRGWNAQGSYGNHYGKYYSGRMHDVRGHYSRDAQGDNMMMEHLRQMMQDADPQEQRMIEQWMNEVKKR